MRSSSGAYFVGLDHVRAFAVLLVFCWHFVHVGGHQLEPAPAFGTALFFEGWTGVALFMTLSGYLFARLLDGRRPRWGPFLLNRLLRLVPLLVVVFALVGVERVLMGEDLGTYLTQLGRGLVLPTWPNGGWSITIELHFYALLPLLLRVSRRSPWPLVLGVLVALLLRAWLRERFGQVQVAAYWTLLGRIDQFLLGMAAWRLRGLVTGRPWVVVGLLLGFVTQFSRFDAAGGFYALGDYPSPSPIWVFLPTVEGLTYAAIIAWYDGAMTATGPLSRAVAWVGACSYSIYLLHFFVVFRASRWVHQHVIALDDPWLALAAALPCFALMLPLAWISMRFVERPFLRLRRSYLPSDD